MAGRIKRKVIKVPEEKVELEGPYECPHCGGHFKVDSTFLDQVEEIINCMYCKKKIQIPEE